MRAATAALYGQFYTPVYGGAEWPGLVWKYASSLVALQSLVRTRRQLDRCESEENHWDLPLTTNEQVRIATTHKSQGHSSTTPPPR